MRNTTLTLAVALSAVLLSCANNKDECKGTVEKSGCAYRNTFEFVWQAAHEELASEWKVEKEDRVKRTITTGWSTNMSPFAGQGRRNRLMVTIIEDGQNGWRATATQESQTNENEKAPLDTTKAKWETAPNDGTLAAKFLQNLDTRLQPDERWRDRIAR
jgi:hypothetical protein